MKIKYAEMFVSGEEVDERYNSNSSEMSILQELNSELCQREDDSEEYIENYVSYSGIILNLLKYLQIEDIEDILPLPSNFKHTSKAISDKIELKILDYVHNRISRNALIGYINHISLEFSKISLMILGANYRDLNEISLYKDLLTDLNCSIFFSYKIITPIIRQSAEESISLFPNVLKTSMCLEYTFFAVYSKRSEDYHKFKFEIKLNDLNEYELNKLLCMFLDGSTCIKQ